MEFLPEICFFFLAANLAAFLIATARSAGAGINAAFLRNADARGRAIETSGKNAVLTAALFASNLAAFYTAFPTVCEASISKTSLSFPLLACFAAMTAAKFFSPRKAQHSTRAFGANLFAKVLPIASALFAAVFGFALGAVLGGQAGGQYPSPKLEFLKSITPLSLVCAGFVPCFFAAQSSLAEAYSGDDKTGAAFGKIARRELVCLIFLFFAAMYATFHMLVDDPFRAVLDSYAVSAAIAVCFAILRFALWAAQRGKFGAAVVANSLFATCTVMLLAACAFPFVIPPAENVAFGGLAIKEAAAGQTRLLVAIVLSAAGIACAAAAMPVSGRRN